MEELPKDTVLEFHPDALQVVRKMYSLDKAGEMDGAIDILAEWVQKQNHFVKKDFTREYLERMIISGKGSVERAKGRLDKMCTLKTLNPEFFRDFDVRRDFVDTNEVCKYIVLPKLTKKYERVYMLKNTTKDHSVKTLLDGYRLVLMLAEYLKRYDYCTSYSIIVDLRECNIMDFVMKMSLMDMQHMMTLLTQGYGAKITSINIISNVKVLDALIGILRQAFGEKIGGRIQVHRSLESVYKVVDRDVIPKDYGGGEERTVDQLFEMWLDELGSEEHREYRRMMYAARTDESLRQTDKFNEQYMGMPGTFRTLKVD